MKLELRILEAVLFAALEPLDEESLSLHLSGEADVKALLAELKTLYEQRGIVLEKRGGRWLFHTAPDLSGLLERYKETSRKLSRAALEVLAIIAYHQPITRAEIEDIRGVSLSSGTLDILMEIGWVKIQGKRDVIGHPTIYGTSDAFLQHFDINKIDELPDLEELRATGLMEKIPPMLQQQNSEAQSATEQSSESERASE